jgi:hypothetical protein
MSVDPNILQQTLEELARSITRAENYKTKEEFNLEFETTSRLLKKLSELLGDDVLSLSNVKESFDKLKNDLNAPPDSGSGSGHDSKAADSVQKMINGLQIFRSTCINFTNHLELSEIEINFGVLRILFAKRNDDGK